MSEALERQSSDQQSLAIIAGAAGRIDYTESACKEAIRAGRRGREVLECAIRLWKLRPVTRVLELDAHLERDAFLDPEIPAEVNVLLRDANSAIVANRTLLGPP